MIGTQKTLLFKGIQKKAKSAAAPGNMSVFEFGVLCVSSANDLLNGGYSPRSKSLAGSGARYNYNGD